METFFISNNEIIFNENTFLISEINKDGTIISVNNDFCKISGYSTDELVGESHITLRHNDVPEAILKELKQSIGRG